MKYIDKVDLTRIILAIGFAVLILVLKVKPFWVWFYIGLYIGAVIFSAIWAVRKWKIK